MAEYTTQTTARQNPQNAVSAHETSAAAARQDLRPDKALYELQRILGNQAMQRSLQRKCASCQHDTDEELPGAIQTKLVINQPGDIYEQKADRVADAVMNKERSRAREVSQGLASAKLQRACDCGGTCDSCRQPVDAMQLTKATAGPNTATAPPIVREVLESTGDPLDDLTRTSMESHFGADFEGVRVHTDSHAAESARAVNALAYTVGQDVVFGEGRYAPGSHSGRRLLAHELAHVIQQTNPAQTDSLPTMHRQPAPVARKVLQAPRFTGNGDLDKVLNNELVIRKGDTSAAVKLIQESLLDGGYTLPESGANGTFGAETVAAVTQFQKDVGIPKPSGTVDQQTIAQLDQHDVTLVTGAKPVKKSGAVAGPLPKPAATCATPFSGVKFSLADKKGKNVDDAANIVAGTAPGGHAVVAMQGQKPVEYKPKVTITAATDAKAKEFQVGFISNLLSVDRRANFSGGKRARTEVTPVPIKDGAPLSSGDYNTIFVQRPDMGVLEDFPSAAATVNLDWPDVPSDFFFVNHPDNPSCAAAGSGPVPKMTSILMHDQFRTWVAVRHKPSDCVTPLHNIDWNLLWSVTVNAATTVPALTITSNVVRVTQADGDGKPHFIQGGPVAADAAKKVCS